MEANKRHGNAILIEEYVGMWTVEQIQSIKKKNKRKNIKERVTFTKIGESKLFMVLTVIIKNYCSSKWKHHDLRNDLISE